MCMHVEQANHTGTIASGKFALIVWDCFTGKWLFDLFNLHFLPVNCLNGGQIGHTFDSE